MLIFNCHIKEGGVQEDNIFFLRSVSVAMFALQWGYNGRKHYLPTSGRKQLNQNTKIEMETAFGKHSIVRRKIE